MDFNPGIHIQSINDIEMNKKLFELYASRWDSLMNAYSKIYNDNNLLLKPTNPLLIKVRNEEDYASADIRLMVFGQETNNWYERNNSIADVWEKYAEFFNAGRCYKKGGQFWNGVKRFEERISKKLPDKRIRLIWNNIVKIGKSNKKGLPPDYIYKLERKHFSVIEDEIRIIEPNFLMFFTGPFYDNKIEDNFGKINTVRVSPYSSRQVASFKIGNISAIRTYHPNYLWRNNIDAYFDAIIDEIRI